MFTKIKEKFRKISSVICEAIQASTRLIVNSYFKSLRGKENFWIVLFGWGVLLYVASVCMGFWAIKAQAYVFPTWAIKTQVYLINSSLIDVSLLKALLLDVVLLPAGIIGVLGFVLVFLYPPVLIFSLFKNSKKTVYKILSGILFFYFLLFHYVVSHLIFFSSIFLTKESKSGTTLATGLSIYILIKTIKTLSTESLTSSTSCNQNLK